MTQAVIEELQLVIVVLGTIVAIHCVVTAMIFCALWKAWDSIRQHQVSINACQERIAAAAVAIKHTNKQLDAAADIIDKILLHHQRQQQ